MVRSTFSALRYVASWATPPTTQKSTVSLPGPTGLETGVLHVPLGFDTEAPKRLMKGWVVLHGMTRLGSSHPSLERFAKALVTTGSAVLIPEIPGWRELDLDPTGGRPTIEAAITWLTSAGFIAPGGVVLVGFSFGCPQALRIAAGRARKDLKGVVGFGGFGDLDRAVHFQFTGRHSWRGEEHWIKPDPYGRWIVGANYLPHAEGCSGTEDIAAALKKLAVLAGDQQVKSWDPTYAPVKASLRAELSPAHQELFDLFAPCSPGSENADLAAWLSPRLVAAARRIHPEIDPLRDLPPSLPPIRLVHGTHDHLIPFTETLRLAEGLPPKTDKSVTITDLFAHSGESTRAEHGRSGETS